MVHAGAGPIAPDDDAEACRAGCLAAARAGRNILAAGGSALDAVVAAAVLLEDNPLFNAGTGACLNSAGDAELDAAVMEGHLLAAGAVASVRDVANPITLARAVMERTPHVLLGGAGASAFATEVGIVRCSPEALVTARSRARWQQARGQGANHGTIGAVAIDREGHLAAATSTGGTPHKRVGRIGDSPLIGAGTYADDRAGAVSMTGAGEAIIRVVAAKFATDRLLAGASAQDAASQTLRQLERVQGEGGIILVDRAGKLAFDCNTPRMSRAWVDGDGREGSGFQA